MANVSHYEYRDVFKLFGDVEVQSASISLGQHFVNFNNMKLFLNREIRDKGKGYTYKSYINVGGNSEGPRDGRPVGKTWYYATSSEGNLLYPSNHWIKFSEDPTRLHLNNGTQNKQGASPLSHWAYPGSPEDISPSSSYVVRVDEVNELIVRRGKTKLNPLTKKRDSDEL